MVEPIRGVDNGHFNLGLAKALEITSELGFPIPHENFVYPEDVESRETFGFFDTAFIVSLRQIDVGRVLKHFAGKAATPESVFGQSPPRRKRLQYSEDIRLPWSMGIVGLLLSQFSWPPSRFPLGRLGW